MEPKKKLVLISGANGSLGKAYMEKLGILPDVECVGLVRSDIAQGRQSSKPLVADLLNEAEVVAQLQTLDLSRVSEVVFIHPVGKFKFEKGREGVDDEVYRSNVETFLNVANPLLSSLHKEAMIGNHIPLTLCAFGSISDRHAIPYWHSYTKSKEILRNFIRSLVGSKQSGLVRGLFVNLSSVNTENERNLRPSADKTYWLSCSEIVEQTLPYLLSGTVFWQEIDVFKADPSFNPDYYRDLKQILKKWSREMTSQSWNEVRGGRR